MSVFKLYNIINDKAHECEQLYGLKERSIQKFVENNLEYLFNIRFLESEFSFIANDGKGGRMDTLGLDENNCPVVIEYKRSSKDNVINQGLFYLDWLKSHQKDFEWIVLEKVDKETAKSIDWSQARLICIANDFNRYDEYAIRQLKINIDLVKYSFFENQILFNFTNISSTKNTEETKHNNELIEKSCNNTLNPIKTANDKLGNVNETVKLIFNELENYIFSLSDNIQKNVLIHYIAYKNIKNIACVEFFNNNLKLFLSIDPQQYVNVRKNPKMRDVTSIGHRGTGNLEITINTLEDLESVKDLIEISFQKN